jgi:AraC family ethanolamine operon transcriptional activator
MHPLGTIKTADIAQYREVVPPWDVEFRQLSAGLFCSETQYVQINGLLLYTEKWTHRTLVCGGTPKGFVMLGGPLADNIQVDWCGQNLQSNLLALGYNGSDVDFVIQDLGSHWVALIPMDRLRDHLELLGVNKEAANVALTLREGRHLRCAEGTNQKLGALVVQTIHHYLAYPDLLGEELLRRRTEMELLSTALDAILFPNNEELRSGIAGVRRRISAAVVAAEQSNDVPGVAELAEAAGVSQRTLEHSFRTWLGITPKRYLILSRLNRAHVELFEVRPNTARVKDIATRWGFRDLGRFAASYKQLFGEHPSVTLKQYPTSHPTSLQDAF